MKLYSLLPFLLVPLQASLPTPERQKEEAPLSLICRYCQKGFKYPSSLKNHLRMHTGEKPFACTDCDKAFAQKKDLRQHQKVHTGEKPYACEICHKRFAQKSNLKTHHNIHTRAKEYKCTQCQKIFYQRSILTDHYKIHTGKKPYACETCHKRFSQRSNLKTHQKIHTNQKEYACKQCGKEFKRKNDLTKHALTHTTVKAYQCSLCSKSFKHSSSLKRHFRKHQSNKPSAKNSDESLAISMPGPLQTTSPHLHSLPPHINMSLPSSPLSPLLNTHFAPTPSDLFSLPDGSSLWPQMPSLSLNPPLDNEALLLPTSLCSSPLPLFGGASPSFNFSPIPSLFSLNPPLNTHCRATSTSLALSSPPLFGGASPSFNFSPAPSLFSLGSSMAPLPPTAFGLEHNALLDGSRAPRDHEAPSLADNNGSTMEIIPASATTF